MTNFFNKIGVVCGPTATGKTGLAVKLAKKFNGEIISADSRQVYRGMDIVTGKDLPKFSILSASDKYAPPIFNFKFLNKKNQEIGYYLFEDIPVWMMDIVKPDEKFNVADYYELAWKVIKDIWIREKLPIVVGGTGFYIKALLEGIGTMGIGPDWDLRRELLNYSTVKLFEMLEKLDPERSRRMNESDRKNPRRLIRAIEVAKKLKTENKKLNTDCFLIGLTAQKKTLYERIDQRVDERVKLGAENEIKELLSKGYTWDNSIMGQTIGYCEWKDFFQGKATKEEVIQKWKYAEHNYARKQLTWFKKIENIHWYQLESGLEKKVEKEFKDWYS